MSRTNLILVIVMVIQLVLLLAFGGDQDSSSAGESSSVKVETVYSGIKLENIERIEIQDDEQTIAVERVAGTDGKEDSWGLASKEGFPVRSTEVTQLVEVLGKLSRGRVVTSKKKNLANHEVSDDHFARRVTLKDKAGTSIADFYLGESGQPDQVIFRKAGNDVAYAATGVSTFQFAANASTWVDTKFTNFTFDDVTKLKIEREGGPIEIERQERPKAAATEAKPPETTPPVEKKPEEGKPEEKKPETEVVWVLQTPEGPKDLDKSKAESMIRGLCQLYLGDPIGKAEKPEHGFGKPTATASLTMKDGAIKVITVGAKREKETDYFARCSGFDFIATLRAYSVDDQILKKTDDLLPSKDGAPKPDDDHSGHGH